MNWTVVYGVDGKGPPIDSFRRGNVLRAEMIDQDGARKLFAIPLDGFSAAWRRCS
jgi:invasion protein IalB